MFSIFQENKQKTGIFYFHLAMHVASKQVKLLTMLTEWTYFILDLKMQTCDAKCEKSIRSIPNWQVLVLFSFMKPKAMIQYKLKLTNLNISFCNQNIGKCLEIQF